MRNTFLKWYPNAQLECCKASGHYPMIETPVTLVSAIEKFLSSKDPKMKRHKQTIFQLVCDEPWFSYIRKGIKPVEGRKNSPKYQHIQVDDLIDFSNGKEQFRTIVTEIRSYASLEGYLNDVTVQKALPNVSSLEDAVKIYHQWSTPDEIKTHGFLGIFVKLV